MTQVRDIVSGGQIIHRTIGRFFKRWLHGRKPSVILAYAWLHYDEGILLALQHELSAPARIVRSEPKADFDDINALLLESVA